MLAIFFIFKKPIHYWVSIPLYLFFTFAFNVEKMAFIADILEKYITLSGGFQNYIAESDLWFGTDAVSDIYEQSMFAKIMSSLFYIFIFYLGHIALTLKEKKLRENNQELKESIHKIKENNQELSENEHLLRENNQELRGNEQLFKENNQKSRKNKKLLKENNQELKENEQLLRKNEQLLRENNQGLIENEQLLRKNRQVLYIYNTVVLGTIMLKATFLFEILRRMTEPMEMLYFIPLGYIFYVYFQDSKYWNNPDTIRFRKHFPMGITFILAYLLMYWGRFIFLNPQADFFWYH